MDDHDGRMRRGREGGKSRDESETNNAAAPPAPTQAGHLTTRQEAETQPHCTCNAQTLDDGRRPRGRSLACSGGTRWGGDAARVVATYVEAAAEYGDAQSRCRSGRGVQRCDGLGMSRGEGGVREDAQERQPQQRRPGLHA